MSEERSSSDGQPDGQRKRRRRRRRRKPGGPPGDGGGDKSSSPQRQRQADSDGDSGSRDRPKRRRRRRRGGDDRGDRSARGDRGTRESPPRPPREPAPPAPADVDAGWDDEPATPSTPPAAARADWDDDDRGSPAADPSIPWGDDADAPTPDIQLAPDLPVEEPDDDPSTATTWDDAPGPAERVRNLVGVTYARASKIYLYDAGDASYDRGEEIVVESDRGPKIGRVAVPSVRRPHTGGALKRVLRRPDKNDRRAIERNADKEATALRAAREAVRASGLPMKVFRAELAHSGKKLRLYFTAEERVDFRDMVRDLSRELHLRIEMRQTGVRDQAKMVGGIGSCGMELCCSTWLPEFVPVSIKNAKDQGLVLNPSKVSGQCGRLKCCLVYEQETYATLRKGLPKLGKRVITEVGEGRVVEVDVLRQRVRVSHVGGEIALFTKDEVKPMFPSQKPNPQGQGGKGKGKRRRQPKGDSPAGDDSDS